MKRILLYLYFMLLLLAGLVTGCERLIDVDTPKNQLTPDKVFTDDQTATSAVIGIYAFLNQYNNNYFIPYLNILTEISADNGDQVTGAFETYKNNVLSSGDNYVSSYFWGNPYQAIYQCNAALENVNQSPSITRGTKNQLTGELKFLRAYLYFNLVNLFGDVPLILTTNVNESTSIGKTAKDKVYQQILADLTDAKGKLTPTYQGGERVRVNSWAVQAFLARVYLYLGDWANAISASSLIIDSKAYGLEADLNAVFLKTSNEAILQFWTLNGYTQTGFYSNPPSGTISYFLTDNLYNSFDATDQRKAKWIQNTTVNSKLYHYAYKYKQKAITTSNAEYNMVLRLAEQYLIRAEARAQLNDIDGALADIKVIRLRAGLLELSSTLSKEDCLLAIEKERRSELFWESGHRWFDLKRTNRAIPVLSLLKPSIQSSALLYPIPATQININPSLVQNEGY